MIFSFAYLTDLRKEFVADLTMPIIGTAFFYYSVTDKYKKDWDVYAQTTETPLTSRMQNTPRKMKNMSRKIPMTTRLHGIHRNTFTDSVCFVMEVKTGDWPAVQTIG